MLAVTKTIMKSLEYQLPALTLTYDECNKIMKTVNQGLIPESHLSKLFPDEALYGPVKEEGLDLQHLYLTQSNRLKNPFSSNCHI